MDERLKFVARLLDGEPMAVVCREFSISRKTGYKILNRYHDVGLHGLSDRSRRPYRQANQLPVQIETLIVRVKREKPHWGAPKIRERLRRLYPDVHSPAISTVHSVLDRHGLEYGMFGHVDAGCLHVRPAIDMKDPTQEPLIRSISDEVFALTAKYKRLCQTR